MLFTSIPFLVFIFSFFSIYFLVTKRTKIILIVLFSYFFYAWWDYRFLSLLIFSITFDYFIGILIDNRKNKKDKKKFLYLSIFLNLGILCIFKYFNFFIDSFYLFLENLNFSLTKNSFNIILPIGISFFTFQKLSYIIDLYNKKCDVEKNYIIFSSYVSLFPQLIAGPIIRAKKLLPQLNKKIKFIFSNFIDGLILVLWGFFLKLCLADTLSIYVDACFNNPEAFNSISLLLGSIFFSFQIYGDFAGYSLIAIGTGKMMGFDFGINFNSPYFANSFRNFWQRWHISLSTWFRDYVYIKLGGNRNGLLNRSKNVLITMLLAGLWHGANFTFLIWGLIHAILVILENFFSRFFKFKQNNSFFKLIKVTFIFLIITFAWIFFRSDNLTNAIFFIKKIFEFNNLPDGSSTYKFYIFKGTFLICVVLFIDYFLKKYNIKKKFTHNNIVKFISLIIILLSISFFGTFNEVPFIYFQF